MPLLNYTTTISAHRTVSEIQERLARSGATAISVDYDDGEPVALVFLIRVRDTFVNFRLPSHHQGVWAKLKDDSNVPRKLRTEEQARRVSWRIIKDWVEAQVAIIEAGQAEMAEVFLPYAVTPSGQTLYQEFKGGRYLLSDGSR